MPDSEQLKAIVSELYQAPIDAIGAGFALRHPRLQGSAGRGVLAAAIRRRLGIYVPATFSVRTYGELETAVCGTADVADAPGRSENVAPRGPVTAPVSTGANGGETAAAPSVSIGVDIEMLDNLPDAPDYWTADFYRTHFTGPEIAYCCRQDHPRMHFAARWCAKEALAKCDSRFRNVDPTTLQVAVEPDGKPVFEWLGAEDPIRLPHALSLTHTALLAAAVVACSAAPPSAVIG